MTPPILSQHQPNQASGPHGSSAGGCLSAPLQSLASCPVRAEKLDQDAGGGKKAGRGERLGEGERERRVVEK